MSDITTRSRARRLSGEGPASYFCDVWDVDLTDDHQTDFTAAVESAGWLDPREGRGGTLADKKAVVLVTHRRMDVAEAARLAELLIDIDDPRIRDPHGPAGAIPVTVDDENGRTNAWLFFGWAQR